MKILTDIGFVFLLGGFLAVMFIGIIHLCCN